MTTNEGYRFTAAEEKLLVMAKLAGFTIRINESGYYPLEVASPDEGHAHKSQDIAYAPVCVADIVWRWNCSLAVYDLLKQSLRAVGKENPTVAGLYDKAKRAAREKRGIMARDGQ